MSVYRPHGSSVFVYDFRLNGRRFHGSTGERTKRRAEAAEERARREVLDGGAPGRDLTLDDAAGIHWSVAKDRPSARMVEYQVENLMAGLGKATLIRAIDDAMVADYVARARGRTYGKRARRLISPAAVNRELGSSAKSRTPATTGLLARTSDCFRTKTAGVCIGTTCLTKSARFLDLVRTATSALTGCFSKLTMPLSSSSRRSASTPFT